VCRAKIALAVNANLERVTSAAAEPLRQAPIGAAAGKREPCRRVRRKPVIQAAGKAVDARGDVVRTDNGVAAGGAAASETRSPCGPALIEWLFRRCLDGRGIGKRHIGRKACLLIRGKADGSLAAALRPTLSQALATVASAHERIEHEA